MILKTKIYKVKKFYVSNDTITILNKDFLYKVFLQTLTKQWSLPNIEYYSFKVLNNLLLATTADDLITNIIDNENGLIINKAEYVLHIPGHESNNHFICLATYNSNKGYLEIRSSDLEILRFCQLPFGINGIRKVNNNSTFFSTKKSIIALHSFSSGSELWRLDIAEIGKYMRVGDKEETKGSIYCMEVYKNTLVVLLTNGLYLGINIENGDIVWQKKLPTVTTCPAFHDGKIYHLSPYRPGYYAIVDMESGEIEKEITNLETTFIRHGFFTNPAIYDDIFAITSQDGVIYLLDKNTAKIKSSISLGLNEKNNTVSIDNIPQIHGNRLYQLDGDKTLHIFEKQ